MLPSLNWRPAADWATLRHRAAWLARIRAFFAARNVLEVETPILSAAALPDPHLDSFAVHAAAGLSTDSISTPTGYGYLHTSPEFPMKRLLAAGSGCIYQIARVFRAGELGRRHQPEFTLLEWYRVGFDHQRLMTEVAALVTDLLTDSLPLAEPERLSYRTVFLHYLQLDPLNTDVEQLHTCAQHHGISIPPGMPTTALDPWLDLLLTHCIEPHLGQGRLSFLYDYPASQAALARLRPDDTAIAERFELYLHGVELANGFHELGDATEQRRRFEAENAARYAQGQPVMPLDTHFLAALEEAGLPDCAGVALGLDRLLMLALGKTTLQEVMAFPADRV